MNKEISFIPKNLKIEEMSLITLAFYGDAVHTLWIRSYFLESGLETSNNLHKICSGFCSAKKQAISLDKIANELTIEEQNLVRRTRNSKTHKPPKNCDLEVYKKATSFEALIGFLMLTEKQDRLQKLLEITMETKGGIC